VILTRLPGWPLLKCSFVAGFDCSVTGGMYIVDDKLPQPNWPDDHPPKVARLIDSLTSRTDLLVTMLDWSTGIIIATKLAPIGPPRVK
jgi:hypothetical protein